MRGVRGVRTARLELQDLALARVAGHQGVERSSPDSLAIVEGHRHFVPPGPREPLDQGLVLGHLPNGSQRGGDQRLPLGVASPLFATGQTLGHLLERLGVLRRVECVVFEEAMHERAQAPGVGPVVAPPPGAGRAVKRRPGLADARPSRRGRGVQAGELAAGVPRLRGLPERRGRVARNDVHEAMDGRRPLPGEHGVAAG